MRFITRYNIIIGRFNKTFYGTVSSGVIAVVLKLPPKPLKKWVIPAFNFLKDAEQAALLTHIRRS